MALSRTVLEACDDDRLFGVDLWPEQRTLLADVDVVRLLLWALGRRSGKTTMAALVCLWDCLLRPELDERMMPGETRYAVPVATNLQQARLIVDAARGIAERSPAFSRCIERMTEDELRFTSPSGSPTALRAFPCSSRGARGWPISCLVLDEAAHMLDSTDGPQVADRVYSALVPATAQFGDDARIIVASSPYGPDNLFARLHTEVAEGKLPGAAYRRSTAQMNPTIPADFLQTEAARDPISFRAEYMAEFVSAGDAFIDMDRVEIGQGEPAPREAGEGWIAGLDPAFSARGDAFGIALVGRSRADREKLVVGPVKALRPEGDFTGALSQAASIAESYGARVVTDQYSAPAILAYLQSRGLTARQHTMSAASKTDIFNELRARIYEKTLPIPNLPALQAELRRLQAKFRAGSAAVTNPRVGGSHGDMAQALALAVFEHTRGGPVTTEPDGRVSAREPVIAEGGLRLRGAHYLDRGPGGQLVPTPGSRRIQ